MFSKSTYWCNNIYILKMDYTQACAFNGPLTGLSRWAGTRKVNQSEARDSEWQWHQLVHMKVCTSLQTDNHANTPPLSFYRPDALPAAQLSSIKALKARSSQNRQKADKIVNSVTCCPLSFYFLHLGIQFWLHLFLKLVFTWRFFFFSEFAQPLVPALLFCSAAQDRVNVIIRTACIINTSETHPIFS